MFCRNCGNEINENDKFCEKCGQNSNEKSNDLDGITKISTPLFILFNILTLGIYSIVKWYRMTGDIRKIIPREETVSPLIITGWYIVSFCVGFLNPNSATTNIVMNIGNDGILALYGIVIFSVFLLIIVQLLMYIHIEYHTLNNIREIARVKQNKDLKYNKFWAFIFGNMYINFVFNTYDKRLVEINK